MQVVEEHEQKLLEGSKFMHTNKQWKEFFTSGFNYAEHHSPVFLKKLASYRRTNSLI